MPGERLPLYPDNSPPWAVIEQVPPQVRDENCTECTLSKKARSVCIVAAGAPGGLLVVGEAPGRQEDGCGRPFVGASGRLLHKVIRQHWVGPYAVDNAVRCFVPSTRVEADGVEDAYRRRYSGPVVRVTTADNRVLTGTPNHPVLTLRGWVPLGDLVHGDQLVRGPRSKRAGLRDPDVDDMPARFDQLFDAVAPSHIRYRRAGTHMDFHGDGGDGDVDVVWPDRELRHRVESAFAQHAEELFLEGPHYGAGLVKRVSARLRRSADLFLGPLAAASRRVRLAGQSPSFDGRCVLVPDPGRSPTVSRIEPSAFEAFAKRRVADAELLGERVDADPGMVPSCEVLKVERDSFSGHVYNLTTESNWYVAEGYVVHNCYPGKGGVTDKAVRACRRYLAHTIRNDVRPKRIITVGATAARSVLGRGVSPFSSRRAYGWLRGLEVDAEPIPVMTVLHPAAALRNRFVMQWFEADVEWACTYQPPRPPWDGLVQVVNEDNVEQAVAELRAAEWFSFDVESMGRMWTSTFQLLCLSACAKGSIDSWVWDDRALNSPKCCALLQELLADPGARKVGANTKYDQLAVHEALGTVVQNVVGDVRLERKLLEPEASGYLSDMAELVGMGGIKDEAKMEMKNIVSTVKRARTKFLTGKDQGEALEAMKELGLPAHIESALRLGAPIEPYQYGLLPRETLLRYNARDAVATAQLHMVLEEQLAGEPQLQRIWDNIVQPASMALEYVEHWGIACDSATISNFDSYLETKKGEALKQLEQYPDINWKSPQQVADLLYNKLKLPVHHETDSGAPSTDDESLAFLERKHPLPAALRAFRTVARLQDQYAQGMLEHIRDDGRIHPNIKLDGARSGRTSCTDPNLQNIPRAQTAEGKMARDCFIAPPGKVLIELDYSQLELRIAAALSGDPDMKAIFESGVDYHRRTAELISKVAWGIDPSQVTDQHRSWAKGVNFGILYGKTANSLAAEWGVSRAKAQAVMDAIMGQFKRLADWCDERLRYARRTGVIWTWWDGEDGRRRPLWPIGDSGEENNGRRITAENGAVNTPIQGTASEFCIASLSECVRWIDEDGLADQVKLILTVHDSLMFEADEDMVDEVLGTGKAIMGQWNSNGVPLVVDHKVGRAWGSLKEAA